MRTPNLALKIMLELSHHSRKYLKLYDLKKAAKRIQERKHQTKNQTNDWKLTGSTLSIRKKTNKRC